MRFADVAGEKEIIASLVKMADEGRVSHALLFSEEPGYGALPIALAFVQYLACKERGNGDSCGVCPTCSKISKLVHPDLHFAVPVNSTKKITPDKKPVTNHFIEQWRSAVTANTYLFEEDWYETIGMEEKSGLISVNESAEILRKLSLMSYEGGNKYMIIWLPERMNRECSNKLLKILEEPSPGTHFILVSQSSGQLLSTIISRCQVIAVKPESPTRLAEELIKRYSVDRSEALYYAGISGGSFGSALKLIKGSESEELFFNMFASLLEGCLQKSLASAIKSSEEISALGRERQKQFCEYSLGFIRKCYMMSLGSDSVAFVTEKERESIKRWSGRINQTFYSKAYTILNKAIEDLERNVNSKFVFSDLSNRFFISL